MFEIFTILNQCFTKYFYAEKNLSALAIEKTSLTDKRKMKYVNKRTKAQHHDHDPKFTRQQIQI